MQQQPPAGQANLATGKSGGGTKYYLIIGIIVAVILCVCVACVGVVALLIYMGDEPENLSIQADYPATVQEGEDFEFVLYIENTGNNSLTVEDIDLDEMLGNSILDGAIVERTDPPMEKDYSLPGVKTFMYNDEIPPGETREVTFYLTATYAGEYGGSIGVYSGGRAKRIDAHIIVTPAK